MVKNRTICLLVRYAYCHIWEIWRRHWAHTSVNSLNLLPVHEIDLKIIGVLVVKLQRCTILSHFDKLFLGNLASFLHEL